MNATPGLVRIEYGVDPLLRREPTWWASDWRVTIPQEVAA